MCDDPALQQVFPLHVSAMFQPWTDPHCPVPAAVPRAMPAPTANNLPAETVSTHAHMNEWPQLTCIDCGAYPPRCLETGTPELISLPCFHFICLPCWDDCIESMNLAQSAPHLLSEALRSRLDRPFCHVCHPTVDLCLACEPADNVPEAMPTGAGVSSDLLSADESHLHSSTPLRSPTPSNSAEGKATPLPLPPHPSPSSPAPTLPSPPHSPLCIPVPCAHSFLWSECTQI